MWFKVSRMKGNKNGVFFSVKCARGQGDTIFRRPSSLGKPSRNTSQPSPRFKRCMIHSPWYRTVFRLSTPLLSLKVKKYFQPYRVSQRIFILIVIDNLYDHFYRFANDKIASFGYRFSFFFSTNFTLILHVTLLEQSSNWNSFQLFRTISLPNSSQTTITIRRGRKKKKSNLLLLEKWLETSLLYFPSELPLSVISLVSTRNTRTTKLWRVNPLAIKLIVKFLGT